MLASRPTALQKRNLRSSRRIDRYQGRQWVGPLTATSILINISVGEKVRMRELVMRMAAATLLGACAFAVLPLAANAVPTASAASERHPAAGIQLVAGWCGPGW